MKLNLIGREFVHFKMHLSRSDQVPRRANARSFAKQSRKRVRGHYRLEGFAKDSETLEEMVVYRALYGDGGLWVRPAKMFFETIEREGKKMKRFELVEDKASL